MQSCVLRGSLVFLPFELKTELCMQLCVSCHEMFSFVFLQIDAQRFFAFDPVFQLSAF